MSSAIRIDPGSSGIGGIETVVLKGDLNQAGLYTIMLRLPAHTKIAVPSRQPGGAYLFVACSCAARSLTSADIADLAQWARQ